MAEKKSSLKKYLETQKKTTKLLGPVERMLLARPAEERRTDVLHPSEFVKNEWCPREGWFLLKGDTKVEDKPSLTLMSVFSEGHAIHEKWQTWLKDVGLLSQAELPIIYDPYRVHGHADGVLDLDYTDDEEELLEVKSIGIGTLRVNNFPIQGGLGYSFRLITRPFPTHIRQAMFYAWVLNQQGRKIRRIFFIYECKEDQSAKEFEVKYDEDYLVAVFQKLDALFPNHDGVLGPAPECINDEHCVCRKY